MRSQLPASVLLHRHLQLFMLMLKLICFLPLYFCFMSVLCFFLCPSSLCLLEPDAPALSLATPQASRSLHSYTASKLPSTVAHSPTCQAWLPQVSMQTETLCQSHPRTDQTVQSVNVATKSSCLTLPKQRGAQELCQAVSLVKPESMFTEAALVLVLSQRDMNNGAPVESPRVHFCHNGCVLGACIGRKPPVPLSGQCLQNLRTLVRTP